MMLFTGGRSVKVDVRVNAPDVIGNDAGLNEPCGELRVRTAVGVVVYLPFNQIYNL